MAKPIAVVTGASRGIGRAIAQRLAAEFDIVAVARSADQLEALTREIAGAGGSCRAIAIDITDPAAVEASLRGIDAQVLVNNAGVGVLKPLLELTRDQWLRMVNLNFNSLFDVTRAVVPAMVARRSGHVVIIGSITGRSPSVGGTCYAATKAAANSFAESLMLELRDSGVKVSVVNPGSVATSFSERDNSSWALAASDVADAVASILATPPAVLIHRVEIRTLTVPKSR
ncbi:MAG TPA: SDR family NAD(P)-dependent oxidoreductase [Gemmatimonadaceae bacterium]|jgi:short-subunit dehydrogenase|nr:SDR family NAD(P)-dependent oxidoreductase [Gemmatimonadaceae bacterium]